MSLFDSLQPQQPTIDQLKADPRGVLGRAGLNIPDGMTNPQQIVNHLLQSGQVSNQRFQMVQRMIMRR